MRKSTLLRLLAGLLKPTSKLLIGGKKVEGASLGQRRCIPGLQFVPVDDGR